jgi:hypothetical protein
MSQVPLRPHQPPKRNSEASTSSRSLSTQRDNENFTIAKSEENNNNYNSSSNQQHWSMRDKVVHDVQTEKYDSMRKLLILFGEVCQTVREEVVSSEVLAREKILEWERIRRVNIWRWDAALSFVLCDAESRARAALVEAERMWREDFFQDMFELEMMDFEVGDGLLAMKSSSMF